ncbi:cupin domain-containing protein [Subtercola lobariae]|uniref:Cupin n=1 Tax=Subtercola lobariae TaxID=1588641 RepID=A0A917BB29_9MICO|nr:cupin domain-containing protein [Subtercola lobariae]GGF35379.1 cupin [Subtercola lobariae]
MEIEHPEPERVARRTVDGEVIEWLEVPPRAAALGLEPHPEGGWYHRTWASSAVTTVDGVGRPAATLIYFLPPPGEASAWHRVDFDEIWLWHGPDPVMLQLGGSGSAPAFSGENVKIVTLGGGNGERGGGQGAIEHPQVIVPAGVWQRTVPSDGETLVSCVVSPGFSFDAWVLAQ